MPKGLVFMFQEPEKTKITVIKAGNSKNGTTEPERGEASPLQVRFLASLHVQADMIIGLFTVIILIPSPK
ncbi:MAG: hypothetical protein ACMUIA_07205 [bacterium]